MSKALRLSRCPGEVLPLRELSVRNKGNPRREQRGRKYGAEATGVMKTKHLRIGIAAGGLLAGVAAWTTNATAQAPAGPLPAAEPQPPSSGEVRPVAPAPVVKPRTSILGAWKWNADESEDAQKKMQEARNANGGRGGAGRGGVRLGIPGMGGGPYGGRGAGGGESDEERQKMQELLNPPRALTLAEAKKDVEIDMFDDQERKSAFFTDGRKVQKNKDNSTQEIAAHWDGNRLVTDEKTPSGRKMSRTYELSYDGTQLYETLRLTRGRSDASVSVRYVYDQSEVQRAPAAPSR